MSFLYVFIGGGIGSVLRYFMSKVFYSEVFPFSTLISNVLASFVLVFSLVYFVQKIDDSIIKPLILIGFCGGFSTFSTFSYETFQFFKQGNYVYGILNILVNLVFCFFIFYLLRDKL